MERIRRTFGVLEIETPGGEVHCITPSEAEWLVGCKVLGRKRVVAEMPVSIFLKNAHIKEVKQDD